VKINNGYCRKFHICWLLLSSTTHKFLAIFGAVCALSLATLGAVAGFNDSNVQLKSRITPIPQLVLLTPETIILAQADTSDDSALSFESLVNKALNNEAIEPQIVEDTQKVKSSNKPKTLEELVNIASESSEINTPSDSGYISKLNSEGEATVVISPEIAQQPASTELTHKERIEMIKRITQTIANDSNKTIDNVRYVEVLENDSLWHIAEREYGDPYKFKLLYTANQDIISDENALVVGQKLRIPQLEQ